MISAYHLFLIVKPKKISIFHKNLHKNTYESSLISFHSTFLYSSWAVDIFFLYFYFFLFNFSLIGYFLFKIDSYELDYFK